MAMVRFAVIFLSISPIFGVFFCISVSYSAEYFLDHLSSGVTLEQTEFNVDSIYSIKFHIKAANVGSR